MFKSSEFGQIELVTTLISFLAYFINLEFYTSIGRYFYQKDGKQQKKELVSTGLWMTLISTIIVVSLCFLFQDFILKFYFNDIGLRYIFIIGIVWLSVDGIGSYLNVIPRYSKKSKQYVFINSLCIFIRVVSTIFYVVLLRVGIVGVLYGHITGTVLGIILNARLSKDFLACCFDRKDAFLIFSYAIPLIPGLVVTGIWFPLLRKSTELIYSLSTVGLLSFAIRITSVTTMFKNAILNAWRPLMYENVNKPSFLTDIKNNSSTIAFIILVIGSFVSLFSYEICLLLGTNEYAPSYVLIPFLCFAGYLQAVTPLRGFAPLVNNKTYIHSFFMILALLTTLGLMTVVKDDMGLYGLGIVIVSYDVIQYLLLYSYTRQASINKGMSLVNKAEYIVVLIFCAVTFISFIAEPLIVRVLVSIIIVTLFLVIDKKYYHFLFRK